MYEEYGMSHFDYNFLSVYVFKDGTGVVEFGSKDDAEFAVKHLDDSKFRSHEVRRAFLSSLLCDFQSRLF